jgi:hypothetical protein
MATSPTETGDTLTQTQIQDTQIPHPEHDNEVVKAARWSDKVLVEEFEGRPVLHHIILAAFEARVYDKKVGSQKDLFVEAAAKVQHHILDKITFSHRIGTILHPNVRPAALKHETMKSIVEREMARVKNVDDAEAKETGQGDTSDPFQQLEQDHVATCRQLSDMKEQTTSARAEKQQQEEEHHQEMAALSRDLLRRVDQNGRTPGPEGSADDDDSTGGTSAEQCKSPSLAAGFKGSTFDIVQNIIIKKIFACHWHVHVMSIY